MFIFKTINQFIKKKMSSTQIVVLSFLMAIVTGTILLTLPIASSSGESTSVVDALFTATTSICVTGLVVVDTFSYWSLFGKIVILLLIQFGGLGIITFVTTFFVLVGKRVNLKSRMLIQDSFNLDNLTGLVKFLRKVVKGTLIIEGIGAVCYMPVFIPRFGVGKGIFTSIFNSVSAFCNAGIDIIGNRSLEDYVTNPWVNIVTMLLIIFGGIGFVVWWDIIDVIRDIRARETRVKRIFQKLHLHSKVVLVTTLFLIVSGAVLFFVFEYGNKDTIGNFSLPQKMMASLFQSVTTRTAGFAMFSQKGLTDASALVCILLMFIGGSPIGTAGGIKTTTFAILMLEAFSVIKGREQVLVFHRMISAKTVRKGIMVFFISMAVLFFATISLSAMMHGDFVDTAFETASALGTAGLSRDFTSTLNLGGKIIIIACMYLGRVGSASMAMAFTFNGKKQLLGTYPEGNITVG